MKYVLVYWTRYGNNKKIVEYLAEQLQQKGAETQILSTDQANPTALLPADVYIFSAPTEAFRIQSNMRMFLKGLSGVEGKKYGVINTHAMKRNWLDSMRKMLDKKKMVYVAGVDFRMGKIGEKEFGFLEDWELKVAEFAVKL